MLVGIHHVAIGVDDIEKAIDFYSGALGFEVVQQSTMDRRPQVDAAIGLQDVQAKMAMLKAPNAFIELWEYSNPAPKDLRSRPCDLGYPHMALQVTDIEAEYSRLESKGMTFVGEVVHFGEMSSAIYGRDPFGNVIELYEIKSPDIAQLEG